ncbi:hypothetical protein [Ponticoccus alexandrii]|uniref:Mitochondrial inner membrane protein n=1 Tax=Ponticoccus alexandrii TaxID=1943633 RepID=A0ABX7F3L2_9RHOB|nr:hypothetical protein [Ponticoccus alexandrii]QRF64918.1 hypothetical protein GQA70_00475 [Ponticoccus alexandrii]
MARTTRGKSGSGTRRSTASTRRTTPKKSNAAASDDTLASVQDTVKGADTPAAETLTTVEDTYGAEAPDTIKATDTAEGSDGTDTVAASADAADTPVGADASADTSEDTFGAEVSDSVSGGDTLHAGVGAAEADSPAAEADDPVTGADALAAEGTTTVEDTYGIGRDTVAGSDSLSDADTVPEEPVSAAGDDTLDPSRSTTGPEADPAVTVLSGDDTPAAAAPEPRIVEKTVVERRGGFVPMLLGGVIAAGIGFAAGSFVGFGADEEEDPFVAETQSALQAQGDRIATLDASLSDLDSRVSAAESAVGDLDTAPLSTAISGLQDSVASGETGLTDLGTALTALDERLTALEKAPVADTVSPEAIAAYERELENLRSEIAQQSAAIAAEREEIEALAREAMEAEAQADAKAVLAESRAALAELTARAQDGRPFTEPLAVLQENAVAVPDALVASAETGVPTVTALAESFPEPARAALRAARAADTQAGGGLGGFLQSQLGARSVTPREGDDPDAVLSRAEAAVKAGDIATALTELEALPPEAQAELASWTEQAALRRDALDAASALGKDLDNEQGSE